MSEFFNNLYTVANQVFILFLLILIGFIVGKAKIFNKDTAKHLSDFCLKFATPAIIIKSFVNTKFEAEKASLLALSFVAAIICHIICIALATAFFRGKDIKSRNMLRSSAVLSNAGFMAMPLQAALMGDEGTFFGAAYVIVMSICLWTYGYGTMGQGKIKMNFKKIIINPGVIAVIIGLPIFLFSVPIPDPVKQTVIHIGNLNTPLPMIVVGYYLSSASVKVLFKNPKCFFAIATRLLIAPLVCIGVLKLLGFGGTMFITSIVGACAPIAVAVTMFSASFDGDTELSVNCVSVSTLISIVTMPLVVALAQTVA